MKTMLLSVAFSVAALAGNPAAAATYTQDQLLGSASLGNSGDGTEIAALEAAAGLTAGTLSVNQKIETGAFQTDDAGNYFVDISPATPGYFILKFGTGSTTADSHYFFKNIADLTKLVWSDAQTNGLLGNCTEKKCRLSHVTTTPGGPAPVPLPASALLLMGGVGGLTALRRRKKV